MKKDNEHEEKEKKMCSSLSHSQEAMGMKRSWLRVVSQHWWPVTPASSHLSIFSSVQLLYSFYS